MDLEAAFEAAEDEFLKFDRIENPPHSRPDISAFLRLHELVPGKPGHDMVSAAAHDEIFLDVELEELAAAATKDDVVFLHRCGVRLDRETDSLAMFV